MGALGMLRNDDTCHVDGFFAVCLSGYSLVPVAMASKVLVISNDNNEWLNFMRQYRCPNTRLGTRCQETAKKWTSRMIKLFWFYWVLIGLYFIWIGLCFIWILI